MRRTLLLASALLLLAACGHRPDRDQAVADIAAHEQSLAQVNIVADEQQAHDMIDLYQQFAANFPEDSLAPVYLQKSADICLNLGDNDQALAILDTIIAQYPGYDDLAGCLFLKGQAYENNEQYDQAREAYSQFVNDYPDHVLAPDTRKMLPYIGLTPEEMLNAILASAATEQ